MKMRTIQSIKATNGHLLTVVFDNGIEKQVNFKRYLTLPVFKVLKNDEAFKKVVNKSYFVEWPEFEIDLSADTLWADGIVNL